MGFAYLIGRTGLPLEQAETELDPERTAPSLRGSLSLLLLANTSESDLLRAG
jgi:hypothetical protein